MALSALPGFTLPGDVSGSDRYFDRDVVMPPVRARDGVVAVPLHRPGLGHEVDLDHLLARTRLMQTLTAVTAR